MTRCVLRVPVPEPTPANPQPVPSFEPGSPVPVTIEWSGVAQRVMVALRVRCHGSGTPESRIVSQRTVELPHSEPAGPGSVAIDLAIPSGEPPSYCGEHVKIDWTVEVDADGTAIAAVGIWVRPRRVFPPAPEIVSE